MRLILTQPSTHQLLLPITNYLMAAPKVVSLINLGVDIATVSMVMMTTSRVMMAASKVVMMATSMVMMTDVVVVEMIASMMMMAASMVMMMTMVMAASVMTGRNKSCNVKLCVSYFNLQTFHAHDCLNSLIHHKRQEMFWVSHMLFINNSLDTRFAISCTFIFINNILLYYLLLQITPLFYLSQRPSVYYWRNEVSYPKGWQ